MKKLVLIFTVIFPFLIKAQTNHQGIKFEHGKNWQSILSQAKASNKYVFADCFATWCGPCKFMAANVFTNDTIGDFFNKHFVCAKVQIDTSADDNEEIKNFYADAASINKNNRIKVFPTYLIFSPEGELVHQFVGSMSVSDFLEKGKEALSPSTQYFVIQKKFSKYLSDSSFLRKLTLDAFLNYDNFSSYFAAYIATQASMYTKDNAELINLLTRSIADTGFQLVLNHQEDYDKLQGKGKANSFLIRIIVNAELQKMFSEKGEKKIDNFTKTRISKAYPKQSREAIALLKVYLYSELKDWKNYGPAVSYYMKNYGDQLTSISQLNDFSWNIFDHFDEKSILQEALKWSKKSISGKDTQDAAIIDTYANLLYKLGFYLT